MQVCYRHPGRETGVSCSNCGNPICPNCMTTTSVGMRCPDCARDTTQVRTARNLTPDPTLTYGLIGANVLVALAALASGGGLGGAAAGGSLLHALGTVSAGAVADGQWWRILTAGFLHYGLLHLMLNMYALYILGGMLEPTVGRFRFGLIYFVSLLAGSFGALLLSPGASTAGASGAIFGLMGGALVVMRSRGIDPMATGLPMILGLNLVLTFLLAGVLSVGGHLGGLAGGALAAFVLFGLRERLRIPAALPAPLVVVLGVAIVAGSIAVSTA